MDEESDVGLREWARSVSEQLLAGLVGFLRTQQAQLSRFQSLNRDFFIINHMGVKKLAGKVGALGCKAGQAGRGALQ